MLVSIPTAQIIAETPSFACNGQFDAEILETQIPSYSKDISRIYIPVQSQYTDDDIIRCYSVKGATNTPFKFIEDSSCKATKQTFSLEQTPSGYSHYQYVRSKQIHVLVFESGDVFCAGRSSSSTYRSNYSSYSSYSSNKYGSNN